MNTTSIVKLMLTNQVLIHLSEIDIKTRDKTVIVRILRVWIKKDTEKNEGLELILVDEWCNRIQATISVGLREKLMSSLMEGAVVATKNFQRIPNNPKYQNAKVNHEYMIGFGFATKVQPQEGSYMKENLFDFIRFGDIPTQNISFMFDILGKVKTEQIEIEPVEMKNDKNATKCDILLEDADGTQVTCVLWGTFAEQLKSFIENNSSDDNEPVIVALQFLMISKFGGTKVQTMKQCTKLFICPNIQEVKDFIKRRVVTRGSSRVHLYCLKAFVEDDIESAYFTRFEECATLLLRKTVVQLLKEMEQQPGDMNCMPELFEILLGKDCLFKVEIGDRRGERVYTVNNVTDDATIIAQISSRMLNDEVDSKYKETSSALEDKTGGLIEVQDETCSNSTVALTTPWKRSHSDSTEIEVECGDVQFSSTKKSNKIAMGN
ncbi:hypothetical protein OROGR_019086 [Orobanche gracilis]